MPIDPGARAFPAGKTRLWAKLLALLALLLVAGCEVLGPNAPLPAQSVAFADSPQYQAWWAETEACAERRGDLARIAWFVVPGVSSFMTPEGERVARWSRGRDGTEIVIAGHYVADEMVVRHEMLHALLDRAGHPSMYFVERCQLTWDSWKD